MTPYIFISSLIISLVSFILLGWKWRIDLKQTIPGAFVIGGLAAGIVYYIDSKAIHVSIAPMVFLELFFISLIAFLIVAFRFYRDPARIPLETDNVILSPADGRVRYVKKIEKGSSPVSTKNGRHFELYELIGSDVSVEANYLVGVEMNILNVHVNRSPIAGKIVLQKRIQGQFLSLRIPESEILNERVTTVIDNGKFRVAVIQIASRLVRRIVSYLKQGDRVGIGQRIGMIKFGSQVDVTIPGLENVEVVIKPGDAVKAGLSVIARY
jgi:phosphatidylserine decarboxylase